MAGDLMAEKYSKRHLQTKKFLEEVGTLIELGNLVESFGLGHMKRYESSNCNNEVDTCNKQQPHHKKLSRKTAEERAFSSRPTSEARRLATRPIRPALDNTRAARYIRKNIESKPCTFNLKYLSKNIQQCLKAEVQKDIKHINCQATKCSPKGKTLSPTSKAVDNISTELKESIIKKQLIASRLDMAKNIQNYLLKDLSKHESVREPSKVFLPKTDFSKCSLDSWKSFSSLYDSFLINKVMQKRNDRETGNTVSKRELSKSLDTKPSLQLKMSLRIKPNSNTMNLQIKSRQGTRRAAKNNPDATDISWPSKCDLSACQELKSRLQAMNKLSNSFSTSVLSDRSVTTPSAQTSNNRGLPCIKPYANTQAVYNVYDVTPYQQPGQMRGIRSHVSFNLNIGQGQQKKQEPAYAGEARPLSAPPSGRLADKRQVRYNTKVNFDSGSTSMQQSLSLSRRSPQSESPQSESPQSVSPQSVSPYNSDVYSQSDRAPDVSPCTCPNNLFQRTKERIVDRVGESVGTGGDSPSIFSPITSPMKYLKNCCARFTCKVEVSRKNVGVCTCSPFLETEQFSVQEGNVDPSCSFLKRCFGGLLFNNKCVACTQQKRVGTNYQKLKAFECEPGTCIEKKPSIFACFKKLCKKKEVEPKTDKKHKKKEIAPKTDKKAKKKEKLKKTKKRKEKKKKQTRALTKAKKERGKKKQDRAKKKGTSSTSFVTSIFMNPEEDDDRQKLLSDEGKLFRKRGDKETGKEKERRAPDIEKTARKSLSFTRRGYRKLTRRIRERYYHNKKMAEEQKGRYACDFYLMSLRNKPCLWVYYLCPVCYPYTLQILNLWRQVSDLLLFFVAIIVWSPCIFFAECLKVVACNMCVS